MAALADANHPGSRHFVQAGACPPTCRPEKAEEVLHRCLHLPMMLTATWHDSVRLYLPAANHPCSWHLVGAVACHSAHNPEECEEVLHGCLHRPMRPRATWYGSAHLYLAAAKSTCSKPVVSTPACPPPHPLRLPMMLIATRYDSVRLYLLRPNPPGPRRPVGPAEAPFFLVALRRLRWCCHAACTTR